MSHVYCGSCKEKNVLFGLNTAQTVADKLGLDLLGELPLIPNAIAQADQGVPMVIAQPEEAGPVYENLVTKLTKKILQ